MTVAATTSRRSLPGFRRRGGQRLTHKMVCVAAAAAFSTSSHAWMVITDVRRPQQLQYTSNNRDFRFINCETNRQQSSAFSPFSATTRLYSSSNRFPNNDNDNNKNELFGFRRTVKSIAKKVLPTKWFGTKEEKEKLEKKKMVKDKVKGEIDQMFKGMPLPIQLLGKGLLAPIMGKLASKVAEMNIQQQEAMEKIMDEAREKLMMDSQITDLLGTPIQIGQPFSQRSSQTVINGRRQIRTEFAVELSGPYQTGVSRIIASNEGIGQLLVEANGKVYNVDLTSKGRMSSSSSPYSNKSKPSSRPKFDENNIIEAEIIDKKETKE